MNNNEYFWPAMGAIGLAIITPIYWVYVMVVGGFNFYEGFSANVMSLDASDAAYLILGVLEIYVYLSLKRILHDRFNYSGINVLLYILIGTSVIFYLGLFCIDLIIALAGNSIAANTQALMVQASLIISMGCILTYGALFLLAGILLMRISEQLPNLLRTFAIVLLICGIFQITFIFGFIVIFLFPVALLILAAYFLQNPEMVEIV